MLRLSIPLLLSTICLAPAMANGSNQADPYCANIPRANWLSATEIREDLQLRGLQLKEIRIADQKCYSVRVINALGKRQNLIMDPMTGAIIR